MTPTGSTLVVVAGVVVLLLAWVTFTLTRLRRLEGRVARAWDVLDAALVRRGELAAARVREHPVDPASAAAVTAAVAQVRRPVGGDRAGAENALGRALRELPAEDADELRDAGWRVGLARRFYNDAVRDHRALRRRPLCRVLRLHAGRPQPRFFDIDDGLDAVVGTGPPAAG